MGEDLGDLLLVEPYEVVGIVGDWTQSYDSWNTSRYLRREIGDELRARDRLIVLPAAIEDTVRHDAVA